MQNATWNLLHKKWTRNIEKSEPRLLIRHQKEIQMCEFWVSLTKINRWKAIWGSSIRCDKSYNRDSLDSNSMPQTKPITKCLFATINFFIGKYNLHTPMGLTLWLHLHPLFWREDMPFSPRTIGFSGTSFITQHKKNRYHPTFLSLKQ